MNLWEEEKVLQRSPYINFHWALRHQLECKLGEIGQQFRPICFSISPNLRGNLGYFEEERGIFRSTSNPQLSPWTSLLRLHVLSLLNLQIIWTWSTHFCLQYPLTPQSALKRLIMSPFCSNLSKNDWSTFPLLFHISETKEHSGCSLLLHWSTKFQQRTTARTLKLYYWQHTEWNENKCWIFFLCFDKRTNKS